VTSAIDRTYPIAEAGAAIRHLLDGQARGKVVVAISSATTQAPDSRSTT
jgi:NADPH:quinone reductase-like Zn-dependent oxidoreductase